MLLVPGLSISILPLNRGIKLASADLLFRMELHSDPEMLSVVRGAIMEMAEEMGFPDEECRAVTRAVDEALANVIRHAYQGRAAQPIEILCHRVQEPVDGRGREGVEIVLVDHGVGADRDQLCGRCLEDIRPGGLGLHFIRSGVDTMEYSSEARQNRLRLVKYLPGSDGNRENPKGA